MVTGVTHSVTKRRVLFLVSGKLVNGNWCNPQCNEATGLVSCVWADNE